MRREVKEGKHTKPERPCHRYEGASTSPIRAPWLRVGFWRVDRRCIVDISDRKEAGFLCCFEKLTFVSLMEKSSGWCL